MGSIKMEGGSNMSTERISELLDLMQSHNLVELELEESGFKVRLCKPNPVMQTMVAAPLPVAVQAAGNVVPQAASTEGLVTIESPIVGTFYSASSPDSEAFVKVGSTIAAGSVVCIIEAMKVMNEVKATCSGTIAQILVQNGEPVEYGQPLYLVKP